MKTKLKNQKGFTIIEVLIVLAIAGLILLIVFLAVPALQRNARNTTAKNDVANVLGGVSENQAANNGSNPTAVASAPGGVVTYTGAAPTSNNTTSSVQGNTTVALNAAMPANPGTINVFFGTKCNGTVSNRAVVARYRTESTTGTIQVCQDS